MLLWQGMEKSTALSSNLYSIQNIPIWLDVSMKRFEYVHPAGGNEFTSVKISPTELELFDEQI